MCACTRVLVTNLTPALYAAQLCLLHARGSTAPPTKTHNDYNMKKIELLY